MGGAMRRDRQMREFRGALDFCGFRDLGHVGLPFTWCNNQYDGVVTLIRLDRGVASSSWSQKFPSVQVHHISSSLSDHCPLWVCSDDEDGRFYKRDRPFRFEVMWMKDVRCEGVIKDAWENQYSGNPMKRLVSRVEACGTSLKSWNRLSFGHVRSLLGKKRKLLAKVEALSMTGQSHEQVRILKGEVHELMVKEDSMWHQRSRVEWLKAGDLNTSYFHSRASQRNRRNFVSKLICEDGRVIEEEQRIGHELVSYFSELFTSAAPSNSEFILQGIDRKVTPEMNMELTKEYTACEVEVALKQMKPILAPGPDGMPPIFFKHYWNTVGQDVISATFSVLNSGTIPPKINHTFISLIPKTKSPKSAKDIRPISLCNVIYKLISKTVANRLKKYLPKLVSDC